MWWYEVFLWGVSSCVWQATTIWVSISWERENTALTARSSSMFISRANRLQWAWFAIAKEDRPSSQQGAWPATSVLWPQALLCHKLLCSMTLGFRMLETKNSKLSFQGMWSYIWLWTTPSMSTSEITEPSLRSWIHWLYCRMRWCKRAVKNLRLLMKTNIHCGNEAGHQL